MIYNIKDVTFLLVSPSAFIEIGDTTSLLYYITDPLSSLEISSLEFKLDKLKGRETENIVGWTTVDISGVTDSIYQLDIQIDGTVKTTDQLRITMKVTDTDGTETFLEDSEVRAI